MTKASSDFLQTGKDTIKLECSALQRVADESLGETFVGACQSILESKGRVVTTGLGKSGHVARKVASTLASTGTSSFFLHPSEALHGDFGMLHADDVLMAFAYGGETVETLEVARFAKRLDLPIVAVTGKPESSLSTLADYSISGQVEREADPHNLAPTASSTVAMAIGDAIAMSVMRARGFGESDFANLHPGGSLGRKLSTIRDHLVTEYSKVSRDDDIHAILQAITKFNHGITAIVDDDEKLIGAISDGDIRRAFLSSKEAVLQWTAKDFVKGPPKTIAVGSLALDAVNKMQKITQLFVVDPDDQERLMGLVRLHDLLAAKII